MTDSVAVATVSARAAEVALDWNRELEGAKMLLSSGLLPQSIRTPQQALYIILAGRDLGLSPVQSLRSINVIQGKVEVAADMQLSLFHKHGGSSKWLTLTNETARLWLNAPWLAEPHVEEFTIQDAQRAQLGGDNWRKYPKAMLRSRAITAGMKSVGFDVLAGAYAQGEIGGPEPVLVEDAETVTDQPQPEPSHAGEPTVHAQAPTPTPHAAPAASASAPQSAASSTAIYAGWESMRGAYAPTVKQMEFYLRLLDSPVFTAEERDRALDWAEHRATRQTIKDQIDWEKRTIETRKAQQPVATT